MALFGGLGTLLVLLFTLENVDAFLLPLVLSNNTISTFMAPETTMLLTDWEIRPTSFIVASSKTITETIPPSAFGLTDSVVFPLTGPTSFSTTYCTTVVLTYAYSSVNETYTVASGSSTTIEILRVYRNITKTLTRSAAYLTVQLGPLVTHSDSVLTGPTVLTVENVSIRNLYPPLILPPFGLLPKAPGNILGSTTELSLPTTISAAPGPTSAFLPQRTSTPAVAPNVVFALSSVTNNFLGPSPPAPLPTRMLSIQALSDISPVAEPTPPVAAGKTTSTYNPSSVLLDSQTIIMNSPVIAVSATPFAPVAGELLASTTLVAIDPSPNTLSPPSYTTIGTQPFATFPTSTAVPILAPLILSPFGNGGDGGGVGGSVGGVGSVGNGGSVLTFSTMSTSNISGNIGTSFLAGAEKARGRIVRLQWGLVSLGWFLLLL